MANRSITIGMRDYDHCRALTNGRIKVDGADLKFVNISPPSQIFLRMFMTRSSTRRKCPCRIS